MSQTIKKLLKLLKKRELKILFVLLIVSVVFVSLSSFALAEEGDEDPSNRIYGALSYIGYGVLWVVGWFLALCAKLLNALLDPALYRFINEGIVEVGWAIVRDVCNLFFILILLIIAFATILRLETYDIKRMLPKLLVIALLINFSKMICGLIIDFSQVLMNTFLNAMDGAHFSEFIANKSQVITSLQLKLPGTTAAVIPGNANLSLVAQIGMSIFFFLVMGIIFLILGVLLLIRIIALWILIILAPLAWLIGIIPTGQNFAKQWWENFVKYCFFGPIMAFFLYLSYKSMTQIEAFTSAPTEIKELGFLGNTAHSFLVYVTIMVLLIASIIVSKSLGIAGAGFMIGGASRLAFGKKGKGGLVRGFGKWGAAGAGMVAAGGGGIMRKVFKKWPRAAEIKKGIVKKAERVPVIGKPLGGPGAYEARQRAAINKQAKEYADRPTDDARKIAGQFAPTREELRQSAGAIKLISQRPEGFEDKERKLTGRYERAGGKMSDIYARRPDWAKGEELGKVIKGMAAEPKKTKEIQAESIKIKEGDTEEIKAEKKKVVGAIVKELKGGGRWSKEHLAEIGKRGDLAEAIKKEVIIPHKKDFSPQVQMWLDSNAAKSTYGTKEELEEMLRKKRGGAAKKKIVPGTEPEFRKATEERET